MPGLFEFMDCRWLPSSLRVTLRESLECGLSRPFRGYYDWVVEEIKEVVQRHGIEQVVELGAGTAPLTRRLAADGEMRGVTFIPCDLQPDTAAFRVLAQLYPGAVRPIYDTFDFSKPKAWSQDTLLVLSASFHHIPHTRRGRVLESLTMSAGQVMVFEPLRYAPSSFLLALASFVPALATPMLRSGRGRLRRIIWCWLIPVAPLMLTWDGLISCLRLWRRRNWQDWHCTADAIAYQSLERANVQRHSCRTTFPGGAHRRER